MPRDGSPTRTRLLDAAERLVIDNGYAATSVDAVIAEARSSKGAFFHHFASKADLAVHLVERYAAADEAQLHAGLAAVAPIDDPRERLLEFVRFFEDEADALMEGQSSCLYIAVLTEHELAIGETSEPIARAVTAWRRAVSDLLRDAIRPAELDEPSIEALADHVFVTFEGAFILSRSAADPTHMRRQLAALRLLLAGLVQGGGSDGREGRPGQ